MPVDRLSDRAIRAAKPQERPYKLADGQGMYLLVDPSGRRVWRLKYRLAGRERTYTIGAYPAIGLAQARRQRDEARALIAQGKDPVLERRQAARAAITPVLTFKDLVRRWHAARTGAMTERHRNTIWRALELNLMPALGPEAAAEIRPRRALEVLEQVQERGALEVAHRCRMWASQAYRWAIAADLLEFDPFGQLGGALRPRKPRHFAAMPAADVPKLLAALKTYEGEPLTVLALDFTLSTMVRTNEVRFSTWREFDIRGRTWLIPGERMKMGRDHVVPLSQRSLAILERVRAVTPDASHWLFPQPRNPRRPMSENTMLYALYRMGWHGRATVHGFRALAATVLREHSPFHHDVIERQLAHVEGNKTRRAYDRAEYLEQRRALMDWWAHWLDEQGRGL